MSEPGESQATRAIRAAPGSQLTGSGFEMRILADIARYTATDAIALGLALSIPLAAVTTQGRALFEQLSRLLEYLCAL